MRFGLFCSPKADAPGFRPETGRGFFDYLEFNVEAEGLGVFGSPTFVVAGELFWGQDRLDFVDRALDRQRGAKG